jgi:hypothetical protein
MEQVLKKALSEEHAKVVGDLTAQIQAHTQPIIDEQRQQREMLEDQGKEISEIRGGMSSLVETIGTWSSHMVTLAGKAGEAQGTANAALRRSGMDEDWKDKLAGEAPKLMDSFKGVVNSTGFIATVTSIAAVFIAAILANHESLAAIWDAFWKGTGK